MDNPCLAGLMRWLATAHHAPVQRVDTHISTVLLVGEHAYKLKKPLRLPFLDFSTLEQRRHFCAEELRLNRRTAPDIYLDVLPVLGSSGSPALGSPAQAHLAIDWVLHMRRFPSDTVFAALATAQQLQATQLEALAAHLAAFHQSLPALSPQWKPGKGLEAWAMESCDEIASHPQSPDGPSSERQAALRRRLKRALDELHPWRQQRQASGQVREAHGDLHLGNVVQWRGRVMAFDAIEFDADLRCIDVMNDAAFTFMDLQARGLPALAWHFINAYVEHTGDFDGLRGLNLFTAYRALVRAKVALLSGLPTEAARYWAVAERFLAPPHQPLLLATMGLSGSGKSTLARLLQEALARHGMGAVRLRSDVERKRLHRMAPTDRPTSDQRLYSPEATSRTYAHLANTARDLLQAGHWVILDAACLKQAERHLLHKTAEAARAGFALVECVSTPERMRERLQERQRHNRDASDATLEVLQDQTAHAEPLPQDWTVPVHRIHNGGDLTALRDQAEQLATRLAKPPTP